jgi:thiamine-phosphate pyrophosphorylase
MPSKGIPRVYPILDTSALRRLNFNPVDFAAALLEGGARIVQFRHKGFWSRDVFAQASAIAGLCRQAGALFVVNDRADYASLLDAGVHLGQEDLAPRDARLVAADRLIGYSTHNAEQMRAAGSEPVNYLAFGPVFPTGSKERPDPVTGIDGLRQVRLLSQKPLVAIGGITLENAPLCWNAGADSVAVISALIPHPCTHPGVRECMEQWAKSAANYGNNIRDFTNR